MPKRIQIHTLLQNNKLTSLSKSDIFQLTELSHILLHNKTKASNSMYQPICRAPIFDRKHYP